MKYSVRDAYDIAHDYLDRGWFIAQSGFEYLYRDGKIRKGVEAHKRIKAFWPTKEAATAFFREWLRCGAGEAKDD